MASWACRHCTYENEAGMTVCAVRTLYLPCRPPFSPFHSDTVMNLSLPPLSEAWGQLCTPSSTNPGVRPPTVTPTPTCRHPTLPQPHTLHSPTVPCCHWRRFAGTRTWKQKERRLRSSNLSCSGRSSMRLSGAPAKSSILTRRWSKSHRCWGQRVSHLCCNLLVRKGKSECGDPLRAIRVSHGVTTLPVCWSLRSLHATVPTPP
jgi:hypothetical protein